MIKDRETKGRKEHKEEHKEKHKEEHKEAKKEEAKKEHKEPYTDTRVFPLDIRLLGKWSILARGEPLPRLRARAGQSLLALLIARAGQPTEREWLAATLWPDSDAEQALYNLRRNLTDLRHALGAEAARLEAPTPRTLRLDLDGCFCDLTVFDAACLSRSTSKPEQMALAVALYRGPMLEGMQDEWVIPERERRAQAYLQAVETLATLAMERACWPEAARLLRLIVAADPFQETAQRALIETLAAMGDMAAATLAYRDFRMRLHAELQATPARETTDLYQRLRARARQAASPGVKPNHEAGEITPPIRLPRPLSDFVGRVNELKEIEAALRSARLVTLLGAGGIGKTRLAIAAAEQAAARCTQEAWFVDLAPVTSDARIEQVVADTLGMRAQPGRALMDTLIDALAGRSLLLILDNCEHVISEAARLADRLLAVCSGLRILTTSRQSLGIAGEVLWRVPSLSLPPDAIALREEGDGGADDFLQKYDAVHLFVERALEAAPHWSLNSRKLAAIVLVCRRLDGIPLALELAAARVKVLSVEQIAQRLDNVFALLTGSHTAALPRHQTLRATVDWSYDLLTASERLLLARLSVFSGGCTLDAAEAVCGGGVLPAASILDTLSELADKSLMLAEEDADGQIRYRLLETIRQYGQEKLHSEGDAEATRGLHCDYYLALAQEAEKYLTGPQQGNWLHRLETDHDNLRAALSHCTDDERGLQLASALTTFWKLRGHLREGAAWLSRALAARHDGERTLMRANALNGAGTLAYDMGDYSIASDHYQQSLAIYQEQDKPIRAASLLVNLGNIAYRQTDFGLGRCRYNQALALYREAGYDWGIASALGSLGNIEDGEGNYAAARALQEESLALSRSLGDIRMTAYTLHNLASLADREGEADRALILHGESLAMKRTLGDRRGVASSLNSLGILAAQSGDNDCADKYFREALALAREIEDKLGMVIALDGLARQTAREAPLRAARLWGATERGREILQMSYSQEEREIYENILAAAQRKAPPRSFADAWAEGRSLPLEQAAREILGPTC